jgi:hypothetical protein
LLYHGSMNSDFIVDYAELSNLLVTQLGSARAILAERERELLELKGPCTLKSCKLHYAHSGPCNVKTSKGNI